MKIIFLKLKVIKILMNQNGHLLDWYFYRNPLWGSIIFKQTSDWLRNYFNFHKITWHEKMCSLVGFWVFGL